MTARLKQIILFWIYDDSWMQTFFIYEETVRNVVVLPVDIRNKQYTNFLFITGDDNRTSHDSCAVTKN